MLFKVGVAFSLFRRETTSANMQNYRHTPKEKQRNKKPETTIRSVETMKIIQKYNSPYIDDAI